MTSVCSALYADSPSNSVAASRILAMISTSNGQRSTHTPHLTQAEALAGNPSYHSLICSIPLFDRGWRHKESQAQTPVPFDFTFRIVLPRSDTPHGPVHSEPTELDTSESQVLPRSPIQRIALRQIRSQRKSRRRPG